MFYIKNIKFNNFRCIISGDFSFEKGINILVGDNGAGKTSVIEGITYFCLGKSFKQVKDKEVLHTGKPYFNIVIQSFNDLEEERTIISYDGTHKKIKNNEYICKSLSEFVGKYAVVTFCPDDLYIIKGNPAERRRFLDILISQIDNNYLKSLQEYKKILKIRNEILKQNENKPMDELMFEILTSKLVLEGKKIIEYRKKYINLLNNYIKNESKRLSLGKEEVKLEYCPNVNCDDYEKTAKILARTDVFAKTTTFGPHRDDIEIYINGNKASVFASQGQIRTAVLAIKIAEYMLYKEENDKILVCLDDVLSELDIKRQQELIKTINKGDQVFITTTNLNGLPEEVKKYSNIINIERKGE